MNHLIGKIVEIDANDMIYIGKLVEINETETHLETEIGWVVVMNDQIARIREHDQE
ncbi:MAG: hypothetical protein JSV21_08245 [Nitrospirota bacterium]|nr:MAG: hypothetical protein JSV21_08245 [Nitrospirota bacterium]